MNKKKIIIIAIIGVFILVLIPILMNLQNINLSKNTNLEKETKNIDYLISLKDVNNLINDYLSHEDTDLSNCAYNYIDEEKNKVIVGLLENTPEKQNEFLDNVFTNCCGKTYIKYLKEHKTIEFKESIEIFEAKIIKVKKDTITVSVIKNSPSFRVGNQVTIKLTNETNNSYAVGNRVRVTFNGNVLDSNPAQIGATKIELID